MAATWLADVLRAAGLTVDESLVPDWKQRGHTDGPFAPVGVLGHHTAGGATGDLPSLATVRDGRSDLAGPLAQLMLSRSGVWVPIAAGRCWHAGAADNPAAWPWVPNGDGNGYLIGVEAESAGTGDWTPEQIDSYPRGVAALLAHMGAGPDRFLGHLEWAPSRKPDPHGWPGGMDGFRATLANQGDDMTPEQDALLRDIQARLRGDLTRPYDMPQSIQAIANRVEVIANRVEVIANRIEQRLITDPGAGTDRLRDIWGEVADGVTAIRSDIAKLTPPAKP